MTCPNGALMMTSVYSRRMSITRESPCYFIVILFGFSSQCNVHDDYTMESPTDGHIRITRWFYCYVTKWLVESPNGDHLEIIIRRMKDITFWFCTVIVLLVAICDVKLTSHWLVVLKVLPIYCTWCLYYFYFFINFVVWKLAFLCLLLNIQNY